MSKIAKEFKTPKRHVIITFRRKKDDGYYREGLSHRVWKQGPSHRFPWVLKINQKRIWHRIFIWVNVTHVTGFTICLAVYFSYEPIFNHSSSIRKHRNLELAKPWVLLSFFDANFNRDEVECVQKVILDKTMNLHCGYIPQVVSFCTATYQL